ncbi:PCMD domain-containing protein [Winogradskyella alexanderae]|uniref:PCMD domain-containing protein n=1 Tax=Winogradskyella alexanderae TaxID=2877123 RepID=A0ABS7XTG4_9FLAO|nr:PCMD domain-containing protein [Winogradskyella alexanderae]MCA0133321.1 PCMD domain-containing protein [Winogradskyella alexanderae]
MKQYISSFLLLIFLVSTFTNCISDDAFDKSPFNDIKAFQLPGQAGLTTINIADKTIIIPMSEEAGLTGVVPSLIEISNLAEISPSKDSPQDFTQPVNYTVTAENNSTAIWTVTAIPALPNPQLPNSDFDLWYAVGSYQQPGESADNTVWGTANRALAIAGDANTNPEDLGNGDFAVKLTSVAAPLLVRMAAATLFTGRFTEGFPNPTDPRSNIDFGTPFNGRPDAFRVEYRYLPGDSYEDADGNSLSGGDQCDIYVLLEKREGDTVERIGTGWFRSANTVQDWTTIEIPVKYGELTSADPEFEYANIREGEFWGNPSDTPTHITVVFSSSALGDFFTGAIGSELWINNLELIY